MAESKSDTSVSMDYNGAIMLHHKFYKDWLQNSTSPLILNSRTLSRFTIFLLINIKILQVISIAHSYENLNKLGSVIDEIAGTVITHTKRERVCLFLFYPR